MAVSIVGNGVPTRSVLTDIDGNFAFENLNPGTYTASFVSPAGLVAGNSVATSGVTGTSHSFTFTVGQAGGANLTGNRFTITQFDPDGPGEMTADELDLLFSSMAASNSQGPNPLSLSGGLTIQTNAAGAIQFYRSEGDFALVRRITAEVNLSQQTVRLNVEMINGEQKSADIARNLLVFVRHDNGWQTIRVLGGLSTHNFQTTTAAAAANNFAGAADLLFSSL